MKELFIFICVTIIGTSIGILITKLIFKKSFLFRIGMAIVIVASSAAVCVFYIAKYGLFHFIWITPVMIGVLTLNLRALQKHINVLKSLSDNLTQLASLKINFTQDTESIERSDELGEISRSVQKLTHEFSRIIKELKDSTDDLTNSSGQLNTTSFEISRRANEQSSAMENISTSMEQMSATIRSTTEKAAYTQDITSKSAIEMDNSSEILSKLIQAISDISKKTNLIEEIAGQTNLLALNAAVEASRAGVSGKGFSVIAKEIRRLADLAKGASIEIETIAKEGREISEIATEKLEKLVPEISRSAEFVKEIVSASQEHFKGIEETNNSIQQLSGISNQNSASAEEMSNSAEELSYQADRMQRVFERFET